MEAKSINEVIAKLENIILESKKNNDPLGYFAALYQKVTIKVKEGIENNFFENGPRMEHLDIVFANRYLNAYDAYQKKEATSKSWKVAFQLSTKYWPIVLQHLLIGMNAHINLDLGIAAAEISKDKNIDDLKNDFDKINEILSSLVNEMQDDLAKIWPTLISILKWTKTIDDDLIDFGMGVARDAAWKFAKHLANKPEPEQSQLIKTRDEEVAILANVVTPRGILLKPMLWVIRLGEQGSVAEKIGDLEG